MVSSLSMLTLLSSLLAIRTTQSSGLTDTSAGFPDCAEVAYDYTYGDAAINATVASANDCQNFCKEEDACFFFTYQPSLKRCFLKDNKKERQVRADRISGPKSCDSEHHCLPPRYYTTGCNIILPGTSCDFAFVCDEGYESVPVMQTCSDNRQWIGDDLDPNCHKFTNTATSKWLLVVVGIGYGLWFLLTICCGFSYCCDNDPGDEYFDLFDDDHSCCELICGGGCVLTPDTRDITPRYPWKKSLGIWMTNPCVAIAIFLDSSDLATDLWFLWKIQNNDGIYIAGVVVFFLSLLLFIIAHTVHWNVFHHNGHPASMAVYKSRWRIINMFVEDLCQIIFALIVGSQEGFDFSKTMCIGLSVFMLFLQFTIMCAISCQCGCYHRNRDTWSGP